MTLMLAFYKGKGDWIDRAVRWATRSPYSHVELFWDVNDDPSRCYLGMSSSFRDGGVRAKVIDVKPDHWDIVPLPWIDANHALQFYLLNDGAKYDLWGILGSQVVALRRHSPDRWFCSEFCATALQMDQPETLSPGGLYARVQDMNRAFRLGRETTGGVPC